MKNGVLNIVLNIACNVIKKRKKKKLNRTEKKELYTKILIKY